jgi:hypothetical protein
VGPPFPKILAGDGRGQNGGEKSSSSTTPPHLPTVFARLAIFLGLKLSDVFETTAPVIPEISGAAFEQTMCELGYPAWYRDDRVTRAIDAAWQECREAGSYSPFDIATAAKKHNLPPVPTNKWT